MRRVLFLSVLLVAGCCSINKEAVESLEQNWMLLGPITKKAIETDESLSPESKVTRLRNVEEFGALLLEVKNAAR